MRVLILSRTKHLVPREELPVLISALATWRERYREHVEVFEFFTAGGGGCGIINAPDDATLAQMMMEYPFGRISTVELYPIVNGDDMIKRWQEALASLPA